MYIHCLNTEAVHNVHLFFITGAVHNVHLLFDYSSPM